MESMKSLEYSLFPQSRLLYWYRNEILFKGERGKRGRKGDKGEPGLTGPPGNFNYFL